MKDERTFVEKAREAWGELPAWVEELAKACDSASQSQIAARLDVSGAMISTVLRKTYKGDMSNIEAKVRAHLFAEEVVCPILGEISRLTCLKEQNKTHRASSAVRTSLFHACRNGCAHSRIGKSK